MQIPMRFAFQGGGAKFVTLLAAAKAVRDLHVSEQAGLKIDHISGTSAGAIVAGILAAGIDPDLVKERLIDKGRDYIESIIPQKNDICQFYNVIVRKKPLYDFGELRNKIAEILNMGSVQGNKLLLEIKLSITATNLITRRAELYQFDPGAHEIHKVAGAIANSCAIPFVFKSMNGVYDNQIVDGGIIDNLPVGALLDNFDSSRVIAFSFEDNKSLIEIQNIKQYISALIDASIGANIEKNTKMLNETNTIKLPYNYGTLEFEEAFSDGLGEHYKYVAELARQSLSALLEREQKSEYAGGFTTRFSRMFDAKESAKNMFDLLNQTRLPIRKISVNLLLNSLRSSVDAQANALDQIQTSYIIDVPKELEYMPFRVFLTSKTKNIDLTMSEVEITDLNKTRINFIPFIGKERALDGMYSIPVYLLIDLSKLGNDRRTIELTHLDFLDKAAKRLMDDYRPEPQEIETELEKGKTEIRCEEVIGMLCTYPEYTKVEWKVHLPEEIWGKLGFSNNLSELDQDVGMQTVAKGIMNKDYPLEPGIRPVGFTTVHWESIESVKENQGAGFIIRRTDKSAIPIKN